MAVERKHQMELKFISEMVRNVNESSFVHPSCEEKVK